MLSWNNTCKILEHFGAWGAVLGLLILGGCKDKEGLAKACDEGDQPACETACEKGVAGKGGCLSAGRMLSNGDGVQKNQKRAVLFFERACDGKDVDGCLNAATAYAQGLGVERDPEKRQQLQVKGCEVGSASLCKELGTYFMVSKEDWASAEKNYRRSCQLLFPSEDPDVTCTDLKELQEYKARRERAKELSSAMDQLNALKTASAAGSEESQATNRPQVRMGTPTIAGSLPPEVIQRIVRGKYGDYRGCYEQGLTRNPSLEGRVAVKFVIGTSGATASAADAGSTIPDPQMIQCVVSAFKALKFPSPPGGTVAVTFPILFSPSK
jgi:hypothetical protein